METSIVSATEDHVAFVLDNLREQDRAELAGLGIAATRYAEKLLSNSEAKYAVLVRDRPVAIFGFVRASILADVPTAWLLGTPGVLRAWVAFARRSRQVLYDVAKTGGYRKIAAFVDSTNEVSLRWLTWLGFDVDRNTPVKVGTRTLYCAELGGL